jgi:hypothetical protein
VAGIGLLSPALSTRSQCQAAAREDREGEDAVAASPPHSLSTAYTGDAPADDSIIDPAAAAPVRTWPLPAYISSLPALNQPGSEVMLVRCRIIGHGYCSCAAVLRSVGLLPDQNEDAASIALINDERRATGRWLRDSWTESQWLDAVPWRHRADLWPASSYQHCIHTMTEGKVNEPLSPAFLWPTSAKLKVGVFLVVDGQPRARAAGVELYHIGEQQAYSHYIVLMLSSGHFESCGVLAADGQLQLRFASDSAVVRALTAACAAHAQAVAAASDSFGPDLEWQRLEQRSDGAASAPPAAAPVPARSDRRAPSAVSSAGAAAAVQAVEAAVQAVGASARRARSIPPAPPSEPQPTVAQLAAHGALYDFISFSNVPQWVGMCSAAFNAYRVASERRDSARQTQAVIDLLMLPQRTLTKLPRGAGSKRAAGRLASIIRARCRDVGAELWRHTGCVDPPDRTVQLSVHTAPLVTQPAAPVADNASVADTESESDSQSDDSDDSYCEPAHQPASPASDAESDTDADAGSASAAAARHCTGPVSELQRRMLQLELDGDDKAARRADRMIRTGHTRRAAQALHSTASMADLTQPAVREAVRALHPPLPADSLLHGWLADGMARLRDAALGPELESTLLPASASSFFAFYATAPSALTASLQSSISALANSRNREACLTAAKQLRPQDGGSALAHFTACSAPHASAWKRAAPAQPLTTLLDRQYRIAARLNLGLPPLSSNSQLPADCPLCSAAENAVANDPWHWLVCPTQNKREMSTRHNAVVNALYRAVLLTGGQAQREVTGLQTDSRLRPDLQLVYPGRHVLTDVAVVHPLSVYGRRRPTQPTACAKSMQTMKRTKYAAIAKRHDAELLPFVVETCGGLAPDAIALLDVISGEASAHLSLWSQEDAAKDILHSVAIAVQKGNAMAILGAHAVALLRAA